MKFRLHDQEPTALCGLDHIEGRNGRLQTPIDAVRVMYGYILGFNHRNMNPVEKKGLAREPHTVPLYRAEIKLP